ncbi:MAG: hypothetical protein AB1813_13905 [Verrucomicrobiota bacterium]
MKTSANKQRITRTIVQMTRLWLLIVLLPLTPLVLLTGCIGVVAVPSFSNKVEAGKEIRAADIHFIQPGVTKLEEVFVRLGADFRRHPRTPVIAYSWEKPGGWGAVWAVSMYGGGRGQDFGWSRWRALLVAFDENGVVLSREIVRLSERKTIDEQIEKWGSKVLAKRNE